MQSDTLPGFVDTCGVVILFGKLRGRNPTKTFRMSPPWWLLLHRNFTTVDLFSATVIDKLSTRLNFTLWEGKIVKLDFSEGGEIFFDCGLEPLSERKCHEVACPESCDSDESPICKEEVMKRYCVIPSYRCCVKSIYLRSLASFVNWTNFFNPRNNSFPMKTNPTVLFKLWSPKL